MALTNESLDLIKHELEIMKPRQQLYEIVKAEMQKRGHWRNKPRGKDS